MYFTVEDLKKGIFGEVLQAVVRDEDNAQTAIDDAIHEVSSYLTARYDLDKEFQKTESARCAMVVKLIRDIALYNCYSINNPVGMPETRRKKYEDAIAFLRQVQREKTALDLPRLQGEQSPSNFVAFGSNKKRQNQY